MSASPTPYDLILAGRIKLPGGVPHTIPDIPLCAVFLVVYAFGAIGNVRLFLRYGKRLKWNMALFGYCMSRITTMVLRMAWSQHLDNSGLAIASLVFLNAGVLLIFLINLMMSKKVLFRTHHQHFQDHPAKKEIVKKIFAAIGLLLLPFLATVIVGAIQSFLTLDASLQRIDTILKRVGITAFFIYCIIPFFILAFNAIWRLRTGEVPNDQINEKPAPGIGVKSWTSNRTVWINSLPVLTVALLVSFEYAIKLAQAYGHAQVFSGKGAFYATSLLPETLAMLVLLFSNMPKRYAGHAVFGRSAGSQLEENDSEAGEKQATL